MSENPTPANGPEPRRRRSRRETPAPAALGIHVDELPPRSQHDLALPRSHRPRRSALQLPAMVAPVDLPEDAAGRIELILAPGLEDREEPEPVAAPDAPAPAAGAAALGSGWWAVAVLGLVLVAGFVIGMLIVR